MKISGLIAVLTGFTLMACTPVSLNNPSANPSPSPTPSLSPSPSPTPAEQNSPSNFNPVTTFTSVIIDARGLAVSASMSPTISADGQEIFPGPGAGDIDPNFVINQGITAYVYGSLDDALRNTRAGSTPLIIKATAAEGRSGVKLSSQDGKDLQTANAKSPFLANFKVIFLLDS